MKVVLLDNVKGIGRIGEIKDVNDGYARNFLFPRHLGRPATAGAVKEASLQSVRLQESKLLNHAQALALLQALRGATISLKAKANQKGTLFSGISREQIADALSKIAGAHIAPDAVVADEHLKTIGLHTVHVRLADDARTDISVSIEAL